MLRSLVRAAAAVALASAALADVALAQHDGAQNLVDLVSRRPELTTFVHLLQRARLIPTLNRIQELHGAHTGMTLFAPTNDAFASALRGEDAAFWHVALRDEVRASNASVGDPDNVNSALRERLWYHVLNFTISEEPAARVELFETLHFPSRKRLLAPTRPGPIPEKPARPPHPGAEDEGGLLGGAGQVVRAVRPRRGGGRVGVDARGHGGAGIVDVDRRSTRGAVVLLDGVLSLPPSLDDILVRTRDTTDVFRAMSQSTLRTISTTAHLTLFLPSTGALTAALTPLELTYLRGPWREAAEDRIQFFAWQASSIGVGEGTVAYAHRLREKGDTNVTMILGGQVAVQTQENTLRVGDARVVEEDVLVENGVIHVVDRAHLPLGSLGMTVEKYLLALNATRFVENIKRAGLAHYITQRPHHAGARTQPYTFLVPVDEAWERWEEEGEAASGEAAEEVRDIRAPAPVATLQPLQFQDGAWGGDTARMGEAARTGVTARKDDTPQADDTAPPLHNTARDPAPPHLRHTLLYHILPGKRARDALEDNALVETELRTKLLGDAAQLMPVSIDRHRAPNSRGPGISFGPAAVREGPIKAGSALIYLVSHVVPMPLDALDTVRARPALSKYVHAVSGAGAERAVRTTPATTYLAPQNGAFARLGLAGKYLELPGAESRGDVAALLRHHTVDGIVYAHDLTAQWMPLRTRDGAHVRVRRTAQGHIDVQEPSSPALRARVVREDQLTATGVVQAVDQWMYPRDFSLTMDKLARAFASTEIVRLLRIAGFDWVLDGRADAARLPRGVAAAAAAPAAAPRCGRRQVVLLAPTDAAFHRMNVTRYECDIPALRALLALHLLLVDDCGIRVPDNGRRAPVNLDDEAEHHSLLDKNMGGSSAYGVLAFRRVHHTGNAGFVVGIRGSRGGESSGHSADVLDFGATYTPAYADAAQSAPPHVRAGGILVLDTVLVPYEPSWFYRWGWLPLLVLFGVAVVGAGAFYLFWHMWPSGYAPVPDALEGEEE
ncbi:hypothetical protein MSPP1_002398 [Malassezia sp. CBS 17886]|nr:hypothetical protein MSPP1_002398 [Malassezia sp. CBS 17886]